MIRSFLFFFPLRKQFDDDALTLFGCHPGREESVQLPLREIDSSAILVGNGSVHGICEGILCDVINVLQFIQSLDWSGSVRAYPVRIPDPPDRLSRDDYKVSFLRRRRFRYG